MTATTARPTTGTRLNCLDNIRVLLTAFVVLHHAAITYSDIPLWYYTEPPHDGSSVALDLFLAFNQAYFMGFFFLVAGFFVPGRSTARASAASCGDRLVRRRPAAALRAGAARAARHPGGGHVRRAVRGCTPRTGGAAAATSPLAGPRHRSGNDRLRRPRGRRGTLRGRPRRSAARRVVGDPVLLPHGIPPDLDGVGAVGRPAERRRHPAAAGTPAGFPAAPPGAGVLVHRGDRGSRAGRFV